MNGCPWWWWVLLSWLILCITVCLSPFLNYSTVHHEILHKRCQVYRKGSHKRHFSLDIAKYILVPCTQYRRTSVVWNMPGKDSERDPYISHSFSHLRFYIFKNVSEIIINSYQTHILPSITFIHVKPIHVYSQLGKALVIKPRIYWILSNSSARLCGLMNIWIFFFMYKRKFSIT